MKKPRVLHIITRLTLGGAQETVLYYYDNIEREKFDVYFISGGETEFSKKEVVDRLLRDPNFFCMKNLKNSINPINDLAGIWKIYRFIKNNKIDIVHTHSAKAGFVGRTAAKLAKVPVIIHTVHGWSFNPLMKPVIKKIYIFLEKVMAKFSTKLITVTKTDIDKGISTGIGERKKYKVIRSGVDFTKFEKVDYNEVLDFKKSFNKRKIIGAVGRLSPPKNYFDFIRIAKELCKRRDDIHFIIVGEGELRDKIESFIAENRMNDRITLLGLRTDVNMILRAFDVLLLTSLWEGLPRVLPEAMYCRVPIVSNAVDGAKEIIKNGINGLLVQPGDCVAACNAIEKLLNDEVLKNSIVTKAENDAKGYSAQKMLAETENLYMELLKKV